MKFIIGLLAIALATPVGAQDRLDPQHSALADLAGAWTVQQSLWLGDAATPKVDSGTADFTMVLNGHQLQQSLHIADGSNFEGLGYIGFDNASGQYFSTWMDVNFPGIVVAYGGFDPTANTYVLKGSMSSSTPGAGAVPVREVMTIQDSDHFRYDYYETHAGKEALTVRLDYTRSR